jgi:ParB family transcriptional regulator, chromosome partitioning protein
MYTPCQFNGKGQVQQPMEEPLMKNNAGFQTIALTRIHESTTNPRSIFDESKLAELAASLRTQGLIQPLTVRPNSDGYEIVAGARRFRAAQLAELTELPVRIVQLSDEQSLEWQIIDLSIVGKSFLCLYATWHVVYM